MTPKGVKQVSPGLSEAKPRGMEGPEDMNPEGVPHRTGSIFGMYALSRSPAADSAIFDATRFADVADHFLISFLPSRTIMYREKLCFGFSSRRSSMNFRPEGKWVTVLDWSLLVVGLILSYLVFTSFLPELVQLVESEETISFVAFDETPPTDFDTDTDPKPELLRGHNNPISHLRLSPDGSRILTVDTSKTMKVWDRESMQPVRTIQAHGETLKDPRFIPGRNSLIAILEQSLTTHYLIEWNLATGTIRRAAGGRLLRFITLDVSPNGKYLAVANEDGRVYLVSTDSWETLKTWNLNQSIDHLQFTPKTNRILVQSSSLTLLDPDRDQAVRTFHLPEDETNDLLTDSFSCSPDEQWIVGSSPDGTFHVWNMETGERTSRVRTGRTILALVASGDRLFLGGKTGYVLRTLSSPEPGRARQTINTPNVLAYDVSRRREEVGYVTEDHQLVLRNLNRNGITSREDVGTPFGVSALEVAEKGRSFYMSVRNGKLLRWTVGDQRYQTLADVGRPADQIEVSEKAGLVAVRSRKTLFLYTVSGDHRGTHHLRYERPVRFSPDGSRLVAGGPAIFLYRTDPWKRLDQVDPHQKAIEIPMGFHQRGHLLHYKYFLPTPRGRDSRPESDEFEEHLGVLSLETRKVLLTRRLEQKRLRTPKRSDDGPYLVARLAEPLFDTRTTRVYKHQSLDWLEERLRLASHQSLAVYRTDSMDRVNEFPFPNANIQNTHVSGRDPPYLVHLNQSGELAFFDLKTGNRIGMLYFQPEGEWVFITPDQQIDGGTEPTRYAVDVSWTDGRYRINRPTDRVQSNLVEDVFLPYLAGEE